MTELTEVHFTRENDVYFRNNRYDALRTCVGEELCQKLANLKLFMVSQKNLMLICVESTSKTWKDYMLDPQVLKTDFRQTNVPILPLSCVGIGRILFPFS